MNPFLLYRDHDGRQQLLELPPERASVTIGRRQTCDVALPWDDEVSRLHAELEQMGADWVVCDDGLSHNGTFVNGERVRGRRRLGAGDIVKVGATLISMCPSRARAPHRRARPGGELSAVTPGQLRLLAALRGPLLEGDYSGPTTNRRLADELMISVDTRQGHAVSAVRALRPDRAAAERQARRARGPRAGPARRSGFGPNASVIVARGLSGNRSASACVVAEPGDPDGALVGDHRERVEAHLHRFPDRLQGLRACATMPPASAGSSAPPPHTSERTSSPATKRIAMKATPPSSPASCTGYELPHLRCIPARGKLGDASEPVRARVRMSRRGPEQAPHTDPPPAGCHLLPAARPRSAGPLGANTLPVITALPRIYVTGHRNPDTDSIASAVGYAELMGRVDPHNEYKPVRLGEINTQTRWVLERALARQPDFLPHVMLRVSDVMRERFPQAAGGEPIREVGRLMAREDMDLVPIVDNDGALEGVMTERALARRYIRESREPSELDAPTSVRAILRVLQGELVSGGEDAEVSGQIWCMATDIGSLPSEIGPGDVAVVGKRDDAQRAAIELGVGLLVTSNGTTPTEATLALAARAGVPVVRSPLDSYVTARMITLSAPCRALLDPDPLTVRPDDLLSDVADEVKEVHYRAAIAVDLARRPIGLVTRTDLLNPRPRRVLLVDHAEQAQSVPGVEQAEIVEILDHHHIGSIETTVPVRATFDPVGSTATLVIERFRQNGMEPSRSTATLLLCAILSDTVILNSPTTTERDRAAVEYLQRVLALDAMALGREMFEATSDLAGVSADAIVTRDAKEYEVSGGHTIAIAQVETVGQGLGDRREELLAAIGEARERRGHALYALMVTDILAKDTDLYVAGDPGPLELAFGREAHDGVIELPGVMSRKKQVAPKVLAAL